MNKQPEPIELLEYLYKYFCISCQINFKGYHPKQICEIDNIFVKLKEHMEKKPHIKVDGYESK